MPSSPWVGARRGPCRRWRPPCPLRRCSALPRGRAYRRRLSGSRSPRAWPAGLAAQLEDSQAARYGHDQCCGDGREQQRDAGRQDTVPGEEGDTHRSGVLQYEDQKQDQGECREDEADPHHTDPGPVGCRARLGARPPVSVCPPHAHPSLPPCIPAVCGLRPATLPDDFIALRRGERRQGTVRSSSGRPTPRLSSGGEGRDLTCNGICVFRMPNDMRSHGGWNAACETGAPRSLSSTSGCKPSGRPAPGVIWRN